MLRLLKHVPPSLVGVNPSSFANAKDFKILIWHANEIKGDRLLYHPTNSMQWKNIGQ